MIFLHVASVFRHRNLQLRLRDWFCDILSYKYIKEKWDERQNDHSPCGKGFCKFTPPPYLLLHIPTFDPFFVLRGSLSSSKDAGVITHAFTVSQNYLLCSQNRDDIQICSIIKPSSVFFLSFWLRLVNRFTWVLFFLQKYMEVFLFASIFCCQWFYVSAFVSCGLFRHVCHLTCIFWNHNPACLACCQKSKRSLWQSVSILPPKYNFYISSKHFHKWKHIFISLHINFLKELTWKRKSLRFVAEINNTSS